MNANDAGELMAVCLAEHPEVLRSLDALHDAAWTTVDPVLLELCRLRVAALLGCEPEQRLRTAAAGAAGLDEAKIAELSAWPASDRFTATERACLAFCEQFVLDVGSMTDEVASELAALLGAQGVRDFATALLVVEQRQRLRMAWDQLVEETSAP